MMLLALCLISGLTYLAGANPPSSVEEAMPGWLLAAWYSTLVAAGITGMVGNLWPGQLGTALLVRMSGQLFAAGPAAAYAIAAISYGGVKALFAGGIVLAWSLVCLWTAKYLSEDLRRVRGLP